MEVNDLIPISSGQAHLGVDGSAGGVFDITTLSPFGHVVMLSGIFLDPILGQSGIIRYSKAANAFQVSVDGGWTFNTVPTAASVVTSVGVIGGANLVGNVDLSPTSSGFIVIGDVAGASPITFSLDVWALSGLYGFPNQGFGGKLVNALTDSNGTTAQGVINVVGISGVIVDIVGQTLTIGPGPSGGFATCHVQAFASSQTWTANHNLNTPHVTYSVWDNNNPSKAILPDSVSVMTANQMTFGFNVARAGKVVILACKNIF